MSFVSYAQNFEDVMLWRALKHIEGGTYVDVGAQHPVIDSVSKAFYLLGWRGVHIEPVPQYAQLLRQDRPDEIVLEMALGESDGVLPLNVIPETGLSTAVDQYAQAHHAHGFETQQIYVPMLTLKSALSMLAGREVHWLKVDVEGFEEHVLKGWDSETFRPWIMVIEATIPGASQTDYDRWDPIIQTAGYRFVYFDGLNRFYIANEHPELAAAFAVPPNVFDGVRLSGYASWGLYQEVKNRGEAELAEAQARWEEQRAQAEMDWKTQHAAAQANWQVQYADAEAKWTAQFSDAETRRLEQLAEAHVTAKAACQALEDRLTAALEETQRLTAACDREHAQYVAASAMVEALNEQVASLRKENQDADRRIAEKHDAIHEWWSVADRLNHELKAVYASRSWRVTAPLRSVGTLGRVMPELPRRGLGWTERRVRVAGRPLLKWSIGKVLAHGTAKNMMFRIVNQHPGLKAYLRGFASRAGLITLPAAVSAAVPVAAAVQEAPPSAVPEMHRDLPLRIAGIYKQLKQQSDRKEY
jgi:FkbM family methyltransferase